MFSLLQKSKQYYSSILQKYQPSFMPKIAYYQAFSISKIIQKAITQTPSQKVVQKRNHSIKNRQNFTQTVKLYGLHSYQISACYRRYWPIQKIITTLNQIMYIFKTNRPILTKLTQKTIQYWGYFCTKANHSQYKNHLNITIIQTPNPKLSFKTKYPCPQKVQQPQGPINPN